MCLMWFQFRGWVLRSVMRACGFRGAFLVAYRRGGRVRLYLNCHLPPVDLTAEQARNLGRKLLDLAGPNDGGGNAAPVQPQPSPSPDVQGAQMVDASVYIGKRVRVWEGESQSEGRVIEAAGDLRARPELLVRFDDGRAGIYAEEDVQVLFA
jgi:hypothetical protein